MKRREFITLLGSAAAWPVAARAQQSGKLHAIGLLSVGSMTTECTPTERSSGDNFFREGPMGSGAYSPTPVIH
jgi:hypothetical protein